MKKKLQGTPYLSVVVPLYNEMGNIDALLKALVDSIDPLDVNYELILVDDGSKDLTWEKIRAASGDNVHIVGLRLVRNFGHQNALLAGLNLARGQAIISMDGDLQHPPDLIPELLSEYDKGNLVVNTRRCDLEVFSLFKRKSSSLFYRLFSILTDVSIDRGTSDFRLIDRSVLTQLLKFNDVDIFLRGAVEWMGFKSSTVPYKAQYRFSGETKYNLSRMLKFASGSVVSFSTRPLIIGIWIGVITSMFSFVEIMYILVRFMTGSTVPGWASIVGLMSLLFGILFIVLGILGIYLARIHHALQNRPRFIIGDICRVDSASK